MTASSSSSCWFWFCWKHPNFYTLSLYLMMTLSCLTMSSSTSSFLTKSGAYSRLAITKTRWSPTMRCMTTTSTTTTTTNTTSSSSSSSRPLFFSIAPMMEYTDRHQRYFQRLMSKHTILYTEMVTSYALVHNPDVQRFLRASLLHEEPLVLQLGGADPTYLQKASKIAYDYGYREFNINAGCPSEKVAGAGAFGAALMYQPELVSELALAVSTTTNCPTTIKCRIGVDQQDSYDELVRFIDIVSRQGEVQHFIVHARKALLGKKFTPADNRRIPPLKYDYVHRLVKDFPHLQFTINGGIETIDQAKEQIELYGVHGVMVGRAVTSNPFHWRHVDSKLYGQSDTGLTRRQLLEDYMEYAAKEEEVCGPRVRRPIVKAIVNLFHGEPRGKAYRIELDRLVNQDDVPIGQVIQRSMQVLSPEVLDRFDEVVPTSNNSNNNNSSLPL